MTWKVPVIDAHKRIQLLLESGELIHSSLDYQTNLSKVASLVTPAFADWCAIDILNASGDLERLAVSHMDPAKIEFAYDLHKKYPPVKDYTRGSYYVVKTGKSEFYPYIPQELLLQSAVDEIHKEIILNLGLRSAIVVPLRSGDKIFGVLSLINSETEYHYTEEDLKFAEELARGAGMAIEVSRLFTESKELNQQLLIQKERLDNVISNIPGLVWETRITEEGTERFVSSYIEELLGYTREEWISTPSLGYDIMHPDDLERMKKAIASMITGGDVEKSYRFRWIKKDKKTIWVESRLSPIVNANGKVIGTRGVIIDISEQKKLEEKLIESVNEKDTLLKEIHHRVKNNMQVISSLINLQISSIDDNSIRVALKDSQNRIRSMALIHEKLYGAKDISNIKFDDYLKSLLENLLNSYNLTSSITVNLSVEELLINIDTAVTLGLIVNELISNSLKYAFPNGAGIINIKFNSDGENVVLDISDNGVGLPSDFTLETSLSLGLQLVQNLTNQLNGTLEVDKTSGARFILTFPIVGGNRF
jgi:PAS domain S-box-containing protein